MFSKNAVTFISNLLNEGELALNMEDEIVTGSMVTQEGQVVHPVVLEKLGGNS